MDWNEGTLHITALGTKYSSHLQVFFLFLFILMKGCKSSCLLLTCRQTWGEAEVHLGACTYCGELKGDRISA